ncbi:EamA family transporter [Pseudonocardia eucalypti]|uniref:EamA family transporter n=1 Tax=Pseudonocardia eucalypti TaxID=648755 RepID=A0ABP9R6P0_9PSEU|nr:inner membrane transporter RhtA [Pseudonocardia eucalypti]
MNTKISAGLERVPAPAVFLLGGGSMYLGAALAVGLFEVLSPSGVAWLRLLGAAVVLVAWRRPGRAAWRGRPLLLAGLFGVVTGLMNIAFYEAIAQLPLGTAVAIEFCGPVAVAALSSRLLRDWAALLLAALGVLLIADVRWSGSPTGVLWALAAAAAWAGYIVLAKRVAQYGNGVDGLAVGFAVATVVLSPFALGTGPAWSSARLLLLGVGVGVLSSVLPYVLDQVVLRRVGRARFAVLLALLPVTATVVGLLVLAQVPGIAETAGILAVVAAVALRSRDGDSPEDPDGPGDAVSSPSPG